MDKIFPRDVPVGTVTEVKQGYPFKQILVRPAAKLDRLEEVIVLLTVEPLEFKKDSEAQSAPTGSDPAPGSSGNASAAQPAAVVKP
jgi:cell shape-determining protein MreC